MARKWFARQRCSRCNTRIGNDGCPVFFGDCDVREIYFCPDCAIRMLDLVQVWYAQNRVA